MTASILAGGSTRDTEELRTVLEGVLSQYFGQPCCPVSLQRRLSPYRSSFTLEELDVFLENGGKLTLLFKDLSPTGILEGARQAKPSFLFNPRREIETYRRILACHALGTAACYGTFEDRSRARYWLFLEKVSGRELYQVGEINLWQEAARWLAGFHGCFADRTALEKLHSNASLANYDKDYYALWMERALAFMRASESRANARAGLERLARSYDQVVDRLTALPATIIHGEFYAANILLQETVAGVRVCPVDWEMTAVGPGLVDLAALTAGAWRDQEREIIAEAYRDALPFPSTACGEENWETALDCCRLHLAVQWLGWSLDWKPPPEQAQDWLGEALRLADKLGL